LYRLVGIEWLSVVRFRPTPAAGSRASLAAALRSNGRSRWRAGWQVFADRGRAYRRLYVYIVLGMLYESYAHPLTILATHFN
jgi:hypothetical protein